MQSDRGCLTVNVNLKAQNQNPELETLIFAMWFYVLHFDL